MGAWNITYHLLIKEVHNNAAIKKQSEVSLHVMVIGLSGVHLQSVIIYSKWLTKSDDHKLKKYSNKSTWVTSKRFSFF